MSTPISWLLAILPVVAQTASLSGRVTHAGTGEPVRRAVINVSTENGRPTRAMTNEEGMFLVQNLAKGKYWITAEKAGFVRGAYRSKTPSSWGDAIELAGDQAKTGIDIAMQKQSVIAGRVIDEAGDPVENANVQVTPLRASRRGGGYSAMTDDRGEYRVSKLPPGAYRVYASRRVDRDELIVEKTNGRATAEAPTYFPGTIDPNSATTIRVGAGEERTGAEIRMQRSTVVNLRGRVNGEFEKDRRTNVMLATSSSMMFGFRGGFNGASLKPDGSFEFRNVRPGDYQIVVSSFDRGGPKVLGRQPVTVGQQDINGITVNAAPPLQVDGRIRADGEPPFQFGKLRIGFNSGESMGGGPPGFGRGESDENGLFSLSGVSRDKMALDLQTPNGVYVKQVYVAGQPLPGLDIDFASVVGPMEIVLGNKPASISGSIEGLTKDSPRMTIHAVLEAQPLRFDNWRRKRTTLASGTTSFSLTNLRPGTYRVAAFEEAESSDATSDPAFWDTFRDRTASVKVGEGETGQIKLKLITAAELDQ